MKVVSLFLCLILFTNCKKGLDEVENNETVAFDGEVRAFDPEKIKGTFVSDCNGQKYHLTLNEGDFELTFNQKTAKGELSFIDDGFTFSLNTQEKIPFSTVKIEAEDFLVILDDNLDCILEKTN